MSEESRLVGNAGGVAAVVAGRIIEQADGWMTAHVFNLALEKIEIANLIKKKIPTLRPISIGESIIEQKPMVK